MSIKIYKTNAGREGFRPDQQNGNLSLFVKNTSRFVLTIFICILVCCILVSPAVAINKSKAFAAVLVISSAGCKAAGVYLENKAHEAYDQYLHTGIQRDMQEYSDEYDSKHTQSLIVSRTAIGMVGLAAFIALYEQLHSISIEEESLAERGLLRTPLYHKYRNDLFFRKAVLAKKHKAANLPSLTLVYDSQNKDAIVKFNFIR